MSIVIWPSSFKIVARPAITLGARTISGGRSLSGRERLSRSDAGHWRMTLSFRLEGSAQILAWRSVLDRLDGRSGRIAVPLFECGRSPYATAFVFASMAVPHSDDAEFSDGSTYDGPAYLAEVAEAAAARATALRLRILVTPATPPQPGMYFSIGDRLYRIRTVGEVAAGEVDLGFVPPLREALVEGDRVSFDDARALWSLAEDDAGALPQEMQGQAIAMSVNFVEAF